MAEITAPRDTADPNVREFEGEKSLEDNDVHVSLTYDCLDAQKQMARVKSAKAGAVVLFAGKFFPTCIFIIEVRLTSTSQIDR